jgi:hypothetical protein
MFALAGLHEDVETTECRCAGAHRYGPRMVAASRVRIDFAEA